MAKRDTGNTKMLHIRVSPELYELFAHAARQRNTTVSELVRQQMWAAALRPVEPVVVERVA